MRAVQQSDYQRQNKQNQKQNKKKKKKKKMVLQNQRNLKGTKKNAMKKKVAMRKEIQTAWWMDFVFRDRKRRESASRHAHADSQYIVARQLASIACKCERISRAYTFDTAGSGSLSSSRDHKAANDERF